MKRLLLALVVLVWVLPGGVQAQDGGELQCPASQVSEAVAWAIGELQGVQASDQQAQLATVIDVRAYLAALDSACYGLDFEGDAATVSDPVFVPAGIYRVTVTTPGYFILDGTILEGTCDEFFGFGVSSEQATNGAQDVFESEGCLLLWETSNITAPYTVTFEKLK